ncbi:MAG: helix-turn-helix domain-containing protein [Eubacterium sp.]|nr:helix-turn-helix domain-containing protein [Eubacterium sp.]
MEAERFHAILNAILDEPDMSLMKLAEISDIPYKTLTNWRSSGAMPDRTNFSKLAVALGMNVSELSKATLDEVIDISRCYRIEKKISMMDGYQKKLACALLDTISSVERE